MDRKTYNKLMAEIADGGKVTRKQYDELLAFAKAKKIKRPAEDAVKTKAAKAPKAPSEPKVKVKCDPSTVGSDETCDKDSRSNGLCATHYSRLVYRAKPENAAKARQASNDYAARQRAAKAEQKAAEAGDEPAADAA